MSSSFGRADMLRAYLTGGEDALRDVAQRLGLDERDDDAAPAADAVAERVVPVAAPAEAAPARRAYAERAVAPAESWRRVERRLTERLARAQRDTGGDPASLTEATARARAVESMRRSVVARWPRELLVVVDEDGHLAPLWRDQDRILEHLADRLGRSGIAVERAGTTVGRVSPGAPVLALTGWSARAAGEARLRAMVTRRAGLRGRRLAALAGGPEVDDTRGVAVARWGRRPATDVERAVAAWAFELVLAVPKAVGAARLRALRLVVDLPGADLATELDAWSRFDRREGQRGSYAPDRRVALIDELHEALASDDEALASFHARHAAHVPDEVRARRAFASSLRDVLRRSLDHLAPLLERDEVADALTLMMASRRR